MDRRSLLKAAAALGGLSLPAYGAEWLYNPHVAMYGATKPKRAKPDRKHFHNVYPAFRGVSGAIDKNVFLYQNLQKEIGEIVPHSQADLPDGTEGEGDCVGQAAGMCVDVLAATDIHMLRQAEIFKAKASVEMLYAGSRVEIGKGVIQGRGGSHGEWVARYLKEYGVLHRMEYQDGDNFIDLHGYNPGRSRTYRDVGVPDWLEMFAKIHPVKEITNVHSGAEALDAICAGQPVIMCSSYAFKNKRDNEGFCAPHLRQGWFNFNGGQRWGRAIQWWHAMAATGAILEGGRRGAIIQNSHGKWNSGPRPHDMPEGSFGVDEEYFDLMVKNWFDCYAISSYMGHDAEKMKIRLYL